MGVGGPILALMSAYEWGGWEPILCLFSGGISRGKVVNKREDQARQSTPPRFSSRESWESESG